METTRTILRPYTQEDEDFLFHMLKAPEMVRYIGDGKPKDRDGTRRFLQWIMRAYAEDERNGLMIILHKDSGQRIGHAGLVPQVVEGQQEMEVGYWIWQKHWRKGYATEIAESLVRRGRERRLSRLIALIHHENLPSISVAEKIGMVYEQDVVVNNKTVCLYALKIRD
ncbi:GNAT family N-acetyltransferase [Halobacillus sp. ACCC02827]|uniref:GNAT family N-acetyltransferase n=1 Tax=Halobacillus sp. ACCC02827 TaxID=3052090 RepID=UPI0025700D95|nr:GNAT family N-acetyltransferase [Halobacillus sp. ACCC02827]WJE14264.1 GNAT family N-acetyltransferase [Halobacillus sp. ACCC02827]